MLDRGFAWRASRWDGICHGRSPVVDEEKGRCRVAAAWARWLVVAKKEAQARRKESHMCHSELRYSSEGMAVWRDNL